MKERLLVLTFTVNDDKLDDEEIYELVDQCVAMLVPDPPVLTYEGSEIQFRETPTGGLA